MLRTSEILALEVFDLFGLFYYSVECRQMVYGLNILTVHSFNARYDQFSLFCMVVATSQINHMTFVLFTSLLYHESSPNAHVMYPIVARNIRHTI